MKYFFLIIALFTQTACSIKNSHTIKWRTASENQNYGYDVYRSESSEGPFDKVTKTPIIGAGTTDLISSYKFIDKDVKKGKDYYYYIESISENGKRKKFTPVKKNTIKTEPSLN